MALEVTPLSDKSSQSPYLFLLFATAARAIRCCLHRPRGRGSEAEAGLPSLPPFLSPLLHCTGCSPLILPLGEEEEEEEDTRSLARSLRGRRAPPHLAATMDQ